MISQIRIYTINKGEMDNFLKHFKEEIMVLHQKMGVPIVGTWVNRPQNEFIWVRTYKDKAELEAKNKEFQAAVAAAVAWRHVAKMECARPNRRLRNSGFDGHRRSQMQSKTGVNQFVAGAQLVVEKIRQRFDPGDTLESRVAQYPKVGVEFVGGLD